MPSVAAQTLIVADATGSGWYITATSTTFTTGTRSVPNDATTLASAPTVNCAPGVTCEPAVDRVTVPYVLPSASTAPTATPLFDAAVGTGIGTQAVTAIWHVTVPAHMAAGTYRSTWVLSLVSAP